MYIRYERVIWDLSIEINLITLTNWIWSHYAGLTVILFCLIFNFFLFVRTKSEREVMTLKQVIKHSKPVWHQILNCCRRRKPDWSGFREVVSIEPDSSFLLRKMSATECPAWRSGPGRFFRFSENKIIHFFFKKLLLINVWIITISKVTVNKATLQKTIAQK
jgi:hypothetical protein